MNSKIGKVNVIFLLSRERLSPNGVSFTFHQQNDLTTYLGPKNH